MKTIELWMGLFIMALIPLGCDSDDDTIQENEITFVEELETGEFVFELVFESHFLQVRSFNLDEREKELIALLEEDPDNENYLGELESINEEQEIIVKRSEEIAIDLVSLDLGPVNPPRPCFDEPANCPLPLFNLQKLLLGSRVEDILIRFKTLDGETIEEFGQISEFELSENFNGIDLEVSSLDLPEKFEVEVQKVDDGQSISYSIIGTLQ